MNDLDTAAEKKKIRQAMREIAVFDSSDIERALTRISEDCVLLPPNGSPIKEKAAIRKQLYEDTLNPIRSMGGEIREIEVSNYGDLAWEHGSYQIEYAESERVYVNGYYISVFRNESDVWRLVAHSWSEIGRTKIS